MKQNCPLILKALVTTFDTQPSLVIKVSVNPYVPTQTTEGELSAICNHQADSPLYMCPDVCSDDVKT